MQIHLHFIESEQIRVPMVHWMVISERCLEGIPVFGERLGKETLDGSLNFD